MLTTPAVENDETSVVDESIFLHVVSPTMRLFDGLLFRWRPSCHQQPLRSKEDHSLEHIVLKEERSEEQPVASTSIARGTRAGRQRLMALTQTQGVVSIDTLAKVMRLMADKSGVKHGAATPLATKSSECWEQWRHWLSHRLLPWAAAHDPECRNALRQWWFGAHTFDCVAVVLIV